MKKPKGTPTIQMTLPVAATPALVERAARMFKEALAGASDADLSSSVTLTVNNLNARLTLNTWDAEGAHAAKRIANVIVSPLKELRERPASQKIAAALSQFGQPLSSLGGCLIVPGEKTPIPLDSTFVSTLDGAAKKLLPDRDFVEGQTEIYGKAIRVGRLRESQTLYARISFDGHHREVPVGDISDDHKKVLFDAVRLDQLLRFGIAGRWLRASEGNWELDPTSMRLVSVAVIEPISGADFLRNLSDSISPATPEEFEEMMEDLLE
jgi:hypothetical protein